MDELLRKLQHAKHGHHHGGGSAAKKILIIVAVVVLVGIIGLIIVAIMAATWLFNRGDELKQAGESVTKQAQTLTSPLNLESYVSNNQVNTEQLQQAYNALPGTLQGIWLDQLKTQIEELKAQSGVSDETIKSLTTLYDSLVKSQNQ